MLHHDPASHHGPDSEFSIPWSPKDWCGVATVARFAPWKRIEGVIEEFTCCPVKGKDVG
jgi:hypothetical protein